MKTEQQETNSTQQRANVDAEDAIASLLAGEFSEEVDDENEEGEEEETTEHESEEEETQTEDSTEEVEESDAEPTWTDVLGIEEDKLHFDDNGNVSGVTVKVDGESSVVSMPDLVAGYQLNKNNTVKSQQLADERRVFEQQRTEVVQAYQSKLEEADNLTQFLEQQLTTEFQDVNWQQLRVEQPAEYAAMQQDFSQRMAWIQQAKQAISVTKQQEMQQAQEQASTARQKYLTEQRQKMLVNNPTWESQEVFQKDMGGLKSFLSDKYGFNDQDFALVQDARIIELIKDANAYHKGKKLASEKIKRPVPKFQKSTGNKPKQVSKLDRLTKAAKNEKDGNKKRDLQSDAVAQLLLGG